MITQPKRFRGFYNGERLVFGFDNILGNTQGIPCVYSKSCDDWISINLLTDIGISTGMFDINGEAIFEGDTVQKFYHTKNYTGEIFENTNSLPPFKVEWNQQQAGFCITTGKNHHYKLVK